MSYGATYKHNGTNFTNNAALKDKHQCGSRTFLKKRYGERALNWYNVNPCAGDEIGDGGIEFEFILDQDIPFRPRIDRMQTTAVENIFILHGDFGVMDSGQKLKLIFDRGGERDLQVLN